jgi:hypothetical protein
LKVPFQSAKTSAITALLQHDHLSRLELSELTGASQGVSYCHPEAIENGFATLSGFNGNYLYLGTPSFAPAKRGPHCRVQLPHGDMKYILVRAE